MKKHNGTGKLSINLIANLIAFVVHAGIQFFIVPILNSRVGNEAFGFISIANEFVQYASIFTILLNGVIARFVAFEIHRGEIRRANQYFNSVVVADVIMSAVFTVIGIVFVSRVEYLLVVSSGLVTDVKIIFAFTFLNFIITTLFAVMNVATFVKNRIDIAAVRNIIGYLIEMLVIVGLFLFTPSVKSYYLAMGSLACTIYLAVANVGITLRLMPELHFSLKDCRLGMLGNLLKTGVWSSLSNLSNVLLGSTTLILGNLFLGGNVVGIISLSKTIPNCMNTLYYAIYNVFTPNMVKSYAQGDMDGMVEQGRLSMKVMTFILMPIIAGVIIFIPEFLELWVPGKSAAEITTIAQYCRIITAGMLIEMPVLPLTYFAIATNKVRNDTLFTLGSSGVLLGLAFVGLKYLSMGGEVIVLSQSINVVIVFFVWTPIYAAATIGRKWSTFYPCYLKCLLGTIVLLGCYSGIKHFYYINSWSRLVIVAALAGGLGYLFGFVILLSKQQKKEIIDKLRKVVKNG